MPVRGAPIVFLLPPLNRRYIIFFVKVKRTTMYNFQCKTGLASFLLQRIKIGSAYLFTLWRLGSKKFHWLSLEALVWRIFSNLSATGKMARHTEVDADGGNGRGSRRGLLHLHLCDLGYGWQMWKYDVCHLHLDSLLHSPLQSTLH